MNEFETVLVRRWHTHNGHSSVSSKPVLAASNASVTPTLPLSGPSTVSSLTLQTFSTAGTFNGTSLATFHSTFSDELATHIFYQDYQGQLRRIEKDGSQWSGGPAIAAVVSSNAKNATPLGCANYTDAATNAQKVRLSALSRLQVSIDIPHRQIYSTWIQTMCCRKLSVQITSNLGKPALLVIRPSKFRNQPSR